jgi:ABC-2 type transport system permease protein
MSKIKKVIVWEMLRHLTNKQFIIGLLITPLIFVVFAGLPRVLERFDRPSKYSYYIIDEIGIFNVLQQNITDENITLSEFTGETAELEELVTEENKTGFFVIDSEFKQIGQVSLYFKERAHNAERMIQSVLSGFLQQSRMQEAGIGTDQLVFLTANAEISNIPLEEAIVPKRNEIIVSIAFIVLIFFLIFSSGTMLMQSALQERRDRMAEIMLSSLKPHQLMQGKIIGHFFLGLIQLTFWIVLSLPAVVYFLEFPVMEALAETNLVVIILFGTLGYLLFSSLYVSMGATMDDLQSANNSQGIVLMIPMLSFLFISPVVNNPNGLIARFAGLFPITSPVIMILRNAMTHVPAGEIILSLAILAATSYFLMRLGGKVFRIGMLMYGKTATFPEILKWLRYKES